MPLANIRCSRVLVGHQPCSYRGGHTSWTCREVGAVVYAPAIGAELWSAYSSLSDRQTRQSFSRTLHSVVDYRDQAVSALNRLQLQSELPVMAGFTG